MPLDPQIIGPLEAIRETPALDQLGVEGAREWMGNRAPRTFAEESPARIEELQIPGSSGTVATRVYRPDSSGPIPVVVFAHSGGWIMGSAAAGDPFCRRFAARSGCAVVSVDYGLIPEHPYPGPLDDVVDTVTWIAAEGTSIGLRSTDLCVAGESSGGNLAAGACLRLRDEGLADVSLQLLVCPVIDPRMATPSWREFGEDYSPVASQMAWMWGLYAPGETIADPFVAPLEAPTLAGLPQTLVITAEFDPLRDEGEHYGRQLEAAGVPTEIRRCEGQIHAVFSYAAVVDRCREILDETARDVGTALTGVRG